MKRGIVSNQNLQAFAKAYPEVEEIGAARQVALGQVQDPTQAQQLQQETTTKMVEVVQKQGLTAETYNQILIATQSDAALARKVNQLIEKEKAS